MTTEQKAKAYDEMLQRVKELHESGNTFTKAQMEVICPELAESEDERIRKAIIELLKEVGRDDTGISENAKCMIAYLEKQRVEENYDRMQPIYDDRDSFESALGKAWKSYNESASRRVDSFEDNYIECVHAKGFREGYLFGIEKQKEQKTDAKSEKPINPSSKFHPGDWVVYDGPLDHGIFQVKDVVDGRYTFVDNDSTLLEEDSDKFLRPLTPKDVEGKQKPSAEDVLTKAGLKPYKDGNKWCILAGDNLQEGICGFGDTIDEALYEFLIDVLNIQKEQKPLTTEETELNSIAFLEQMGYTCIPPRKEQKPAEPRKRNKPKESWLSKAKYEIEHADELLIQRQEELREIRELKKQEQHPSSKFQSGDWVVYDGPLGHAILQVKNVVDGRYTFVDNESTLLVEDSDKFLRPLTPKDVEKKVEWSEEDEATIGTLINYFEGDALDCSTDEMIRRIRALRPSWKPSEEQMGALEHFIRCWGESGTMSPQNTILCAANSLLNDLKKL